MQIYGKNQKKKRKRKKTESSYVASDQHSLVVSMFVFLSMYFLIIQLEQWIVSK